MTPKMWNNKRKSIDYFSGYISIKKKLDRDLPNGYPVWSTFIFAKDEKQTHVLRSTHFRVSLDRGSDFDREIGKSFSAVGEIGTFMVIIFSLLLAFFFLTGDEFSTVGLSLGYIGGP